MAVLTYFPIELLSITCILALFIVIYGINMLMRTKDSLPLPPGPLEWPLIGNLHQIGPQPHVTFTEMARVYGNVFRFKMGSWKAVVLNGHCNIAECLGSRGELFADRPPFWTSQVGKSNSQLTLSRCNTFWKTQRKLSHKAVRLLTDKMKENMQTILLVETDRLVEVLLESNGQATDPYTQIHTSAVSVLGTVFFEEGYHRWDPTVETYCACAKNISELNTVSKLIDLLPFLKYVLPHYMKDISDNIRAMEKIIGRSITEHVKSYDHEYVRDICDALIGHMLSARGDYRSLDKNRILGIVTSIMYHGSEIITAALDWAILYMVKFPEIQKKIHAELDDVIDEDHVTTSDVTQLPFTHACVFEILRHSTPMPLGLPHYTLRDCEFEGYTISKETLIIPNLWSANHDPNIWLDPDSFNPSRFINEEGILDQETAYDTMSFSTGERNCLGHDLAVSELFILFANILLQCELMALEGVSYTLDGEFSNTLKPKPYEIIIESRLE